MGVVLEDGIDALLAAANPDPDETLHAMLDHGIERDFPVIGPDAGRVLRVLATLAGAERVFEFGSGFGYSAAWFVDALPADGELVLTDLDADNLADAESFLADYRGGTTVRYEQGDANEVFASYSGEWDVVLVDHDKTSYAETFEQVRDAVAPGGVVVADNTMAGPVEPDDVTSALQGGAPSTEHVAGVVEYIERVRDADGFETVFLPIGEGLGVSVKQ